MTRWLIWLSVVIAWTLALEFPVPDQGPGAAGEFILTNKILLGKTAHVGVYVVLAALASWVPMPVRYRWLMMFFLMGHAWGTEMLQEALHEWCHRGGTLSDIGLDIIGITIGTGLTWKWWTRD